LTAITAAEMAKVTRPMAAPTAEMIGPRTMSATPMPTIPAITAAMIVMTSRFSSIQAALLAATRVSH
jgi:hypothetical protein